jgi:holo-[acyl-carrier protein] synthase
MVSRSLELTDRGCAKYLIARVKRAPRFGVDSSGGSIMIISTGVDLAEVDRIQAALQDPRTGERFRARVYTEKEIAYCEKKQRGKYESYAGRFAAKEAVMKALGRGWGAKVRWLDIEVARARSGKPEIVLHDKTARLANELGICRWALSITHTKGHGLAFVVAEDG